MGRIQIFFTFTKWAGFTRRLASPPWLERAVLVEWGRQCMNRESSVGDNKAVNRRNNSTLFYLYRTISYNTYSNSKCFTWKHKENIKKCLWTETSTYTYTNKYTYADIHTLQKRLVLKEHSVGVHLTVPFHRCMIAECHLTTFWICARYMEISALWPERSVGIVNWQQVGDVPWSQTSKCFVYQEEDF